MWLLDFIALLGQKTLGSVRSVGRASILLFHALYAKPQRNAFHLVIKQIHMIGVLSIVIICVSGAFIGMVLSIQGYSLLKNYGSEQIIGQMIALSLIRELGPVVTALLFAGRAGSAITAEIGLMKATEQLASLEMMGVDPLRRIIAPRFYGGIIALPLLTILFNYMGIIFGALVSIEWLQVFSGSFWGNMQAVVSFDGDIVNSIIKSIIFAFAVIWISVFHGYDCVPTSAGISKATTKTVVYSSLAILGLDFVLTALMFGDF